MSFSGDLGIVRNDTYLSKMKVIRTVHLLRRCAVILLLMAAPLTAHADQTDPRLDDLFATLKSTADKNLASEVQQEIWGEDLEEALESAPRVELVALSPEMVLFYRRLDEVRNGGGLFFSEPILAYSNVSSGYGCFGLYTSTPIDLD